MRIKTGMGEHIKIIRARKEKLPEISEIFKNESAKEPYFQKWSKITALKKINEFFNKDELHIVIIKKEIVGFMVSHINADNKKKAYIEELWIKPRYQGRGVGKAFMKFIEGQYLKRGVSTIQLVAKRKAGAFQFYKKLGYAESGDLVFMDKMLSSDVTENRNTTNLINQKI